MTVKVVCDTTGVVYSVSQVGDVLSIGRHPRECQIVLPLDASGVSRIHATLRWAKEDELELEDASSYGTTVNGGNVLKSSAILRNGGKFQVGTFQFTVEVPRPQVEQSRKRYGQDVLVSKPKRTKTTMPTAPGTSQRKVSDFFSQRQSQILAEETPLNQMGASKQRDIGSTSVVANSQLTMPKEEIEFVEPVVKKKKKTSLFSEQAKSHPMTGTMICRETPPSQLVAAKNQFHYGEEIVESSQEDVLAADGVEDVKIEEDAWNDVHSQMNLQPIAHSTQRVGTTATLSVPSTSKAKKKKSVFETPDAPSQFKAPLFSSREKSFQLAPIQEFDNIPENSFSTVSAAPRSRKRSAFGETQAKTTPMVAEPKRNLSVLSDGYGNREQNNSTNFDYSCVSSGKKHEDESQPDDEPKGKPINEADIEKVVKNMAKMIKFVALERTWHPNTTTTSETTLPTNATQKPNFKKFKKASQGRFNTSIPCISSALGGGADLVDFRKIRH